MKKNKSDIDNHRDYMPYGDEWKAEINKLPKNIIIDLFANKVISLEKIRIENDTKYVNILGEADEEINELKAKNNKLIKAISWALGIIDIFPTKKENEGNFHWRTELRERSGLTNEELEKFSKNKNKNKK